MTYHIGDRIRITATFTAPDRTPVDPAALVARVKTPGGVITSYTYGVDAEVVKTADGVYYIDLDVDSNGTWYWRLAGTGDGQAADEGSVAVDRSEF